MKPELYVKNQQRSRLIDRRHLCRIIRSALRDDLHREEYILAVYLVGDKAITRLNEQHLRHAGPTDVITFDYGSNRGSKGPEPALIADIFICVEEATRQSTRHRTTWQSEVIRYIVHGLLHVCGHDDQNPVARKKMKQEEGRILRELSIRFSLNRIGST